MKKLGLLITAASTLVLGACSAAASHLGDLPERDARIIVEVDYNIDKLSNEGARKTQDIVYNNIKEYATSNIRLAGRYNVLNNAFVLEVNNADVESIKSVPGVKSVTVDSLHWVRNYTDDGYVPLGDGGENASDEENVSATTMKKPANTNDGEGTIIAILDNEFHLRGNNDDPKDKNHGQKWCHEVYSPLADDVAVRYTYDSIGQAIKEAGSDLHANGGSGRKSGTAAGDEGSMYFNNKVPFYFDYGGTSKARGKRGPISFDVHSDLSYHGSHVSSITAANAPTYKGIAPKAQLALMKVFTDYNAEGVGERLGFGNSTGAYDTVILEALEDCIKLKVDGINMSLGSDLDDFDSNSITLKTLTKLNEEGILTSISAGNSGKTSFSTTGAYANWMPESVETGILSSYANNAASMTIASGQPTKIFYENAFVIDGENIAFEDQIVNRQGTDDDYEVEIRMRDIYADKPLDWVYIPGFGASADYADKDVKGKVVFVNRGSTTFADKYAQAVSKKAIAIVIINNDPTASDFNFRCSFGDGFSPTIPCALVLFKDKAKFESKGSGSFEMISKQVSDNPNQYTLSSFSSDGATFDLDLKPEITAPGDNIKGAVPEHAMTTLTKAERESDEYNNKSYQYLSGTSMSAPNYAGAQAVVLSNVTKDIVTAQNARQAANPTSVEAYTAEELAAINDYRQTVNMRLMSTADPMLDLVANPEDKEETRSVSSPRIQGAGMVDLGGALATDVYLEGLDLNDKPIGKAKIALRNNDDIARGDIKLKFLAHNESQENRSYDVTLTVMRPAIANPNDIVTKDYNYKGAVESIESLSGMKYFDKDLNKMQTARGSYAFKDAYKVSKDIEYYASKEDYAADKKTIISKGFYYNSATNGVSWDPLPSYTAQSTKDVEIARISGQTITVEPGDHQVTINPYSLPDEEKNKILSVYEYGCMIEGYVTLTSKDNKPDLSIPYLGFYSGTDKDENASYASAPVAEPFNFEKEVSQVYPSDLVNDITKSLTGRDKVNFESMIVAGYAENPQKIDVDRIDTNDQSFDKMTGFYKVGTNPLNNEYVENAADNIYVGGEATNTMIIQQFMLRSVADNDFTLTNKETNEVVYKSALKDNLFGDSAGKWALYKSHVDAGYLSAGYVAHRAYAIVPLYDEMTGEKFPSGEYELKFNYLLAATNTVVSKTYTVHIDTQVPEVTGIGQYIQENVHRVRIYLQDAKLSYGIVGYSRVELHYDNEKGQYYIDETKEFVDEAIEELSEGLSNKRLYIGAVDYARGKVGCIVHFNDQKNFLKGYQIVQGSGIASYTDYSLSQDGKLSFTNTNTSKPMSVKGDVKISTFSAMDYNFPNIPTDVDDAIPAQDTFSNSETLRGGGCHGSIATLGALICIPSLMGATLLFFRKRKGGKQYMKKKLSIGLLLALSLSLVVGCGGNNNKNNNSSGDNSDNSSDTSNTSSSEAPREYDFDISLSNGSKTLNKGEEAHIVVTADGGEANVERKYSYKSSDPEILSVNASTGTVVALAEGSARILVSEEVSKKSKQLQITVTDATLANGGYNFASLAGQEAVEKRTEILGKLEKYAMDNHLTGITLFENGGYVKYSSRVTLPTTEYITGYGFGLLSEGSIDSDLKSEENAAYKRYLHSATSSDPATINARNDTGSQVSDLEGYITSSYWGTKLNKTKTQYEWYPVLAKDTIKVNGQDTPFNRPVPVEDGQEIFTGNEEKANPLGLYKTWRIYVKTGADGIKYRYSGGAWGDKVFDKRDVTLEDYEFAYRLLLTGSHNLKRGPEYAADQTYGIKGALAYNTRTKIMNDEEAENTWKAMKADGDLGIVTGTDPVNGPYIQLTILNAIDKFTAMYTLSSNLLSPMPEEFIRTIGNGSLAAGAKRYGTFSDDKDLLSRPNAEVDIKGTKVNKIILDLTLSVGPYMLEDWISEQTIVFKRNETWVEPGRYNIAGVKLLVIDASTDADAIYNQFNAGILDSCGIPSKHIKEEMGKAGVHKTKGDSTFKLNVNSCTQETWNELFGANGTINKNSDWEVKPWMSNDNFLNGLFYSIDRKTFAEKRGVNPSINYFADSYLNDPENGKSYNSTQAHKDAVAAYETKNSKGESTYGYSLDKAILSFKAAVSELKKSGDLEDGQTITIHIKWMYETDVSEYGEEIAGYFETAFNNPRVSNGKIKLKVTQDAVTNWQEVYNEFLMKGQFDLGFGAISGNTYNPLNFLQVLKSDNESGFTLNWGTDTSKVTKDKPLIYDNKIWSFDSLWAVADHGGIVKNGENIKPVQLSYVDYKDIGNNIYEGGTFSVPTTFFEDPETVKFEVSRVSVYLVGGGNYDLDFKVDNTGKIVVTLPKESVNSKVVTGKSINDEIRRINKLDSDDKDQTKENIAHPFNINMYGTYWTIEVYFTISIKDPKTGGWGTPSESYVTAAKNPKLWEG